MHALLIVVLLLAFWPPIDPPPLLPAVWTLANLVIGLLLVRALAELPALYLSHQIKVQPARRWHWLWLYYRWRQIHLALLFGMYAWCVLGLHWPTFVRREAGLANTILMDEFLILLPFLLGLLLSWESFYRVEKAMHQSAGLGSPRRFWPRFDYLVFQARQHLGLVLVPLTLFMGLQETAQWLLPRTMAHPDQHLAVTLALGLLVLAAMPWLLTHIFLTSSLPDGPLRQRLTAAARRLRFPFTDIRLWHTRLGLANAMVTGFLPRPRYVLLSDLLLDQLESDEVEAVLCHEIAHLHHRHIPLYLLFMALSITLLAQALQLAAQLLPEDVVRLLTSPEWSSEAMPHWTAWLFFACALGIVGGYIRLVFGALSRNCERQADVFACKHMQVTAAPVMATPSSADAASNGTARVTVPAAPRTGLAAGVPVFVAALEKVAELNGIPMEKPSWRHGSIARRAEFLKRLAGHPAREPQLQRRWLAGKAGLLAALTAAVLVLWHFGANPLVLLAM